MVDPDALEAWIAKATPGPWVEGRHGYIGAPPHGGDGPVRQLATVLGDAPMYGDPARTVEEIRDATTTTIVALRNAAEEMIAELRAARKVVEAANTVSISCNFGFLDEALADYNDAVKP